MFLRVRQAAMAQAPAAPAAHGRVATAQGAALRQVAKPEGGERRADRALPSRVPGRGDGGTARAGPALAPWPRPLQAAAHSGERRAAGWTQVAVRRGRRRTSFPGRGPFGPGRGCRGRGHRKSRGAGGGARDGAGGTGERGAAAAQASSLRGGGTAHPIGADPGPGAPSRSGRAGSGAAPAPGSDAGQAGPGLRAEPAFPHPGLPFLPPAPPAWPSAAAPSPPRGPL